MPSGNRAVRIPANLGVIMRMQIDEARRDDKSVGVDNLLGKSGCAAANLHDLAVFDPNVGAISRGAGAIYDCSAFYLKIEIGHFSVPSVAVGRLAATVFSANAGRIRMIP